MVDFRKRLTTSSTTKPVNPRDIYDRLDRESDKGPIRPAQGAVLDDWFTDRRSERDVIFKLHTGEGKTLIGLLVLQSKLNETDGRALYVCPNNFLVQQTLIQAKQFGIHAVKVGADGELPVGFLDGKALLVTSVQKLFNGRTKFGLGPDSEHVDWLVLDDAHACIDSIKAACVIRFPSDHQAYTDIVSLFAADLEMQGVGTFAEIKARDSGAFLPVPYWSWAEHEKNVASILVKFKDENTLRFVWPLLRDTLANCLCIVSGRELVITPYLAPLELFGSFTNATHRVFMSATVTDDSFLIKGLRLNPGAVRHPLVYDAARWSGEKMVLIPSLIDESLTRTEIVNAFSKPDPQRKSGVVALVPSFESSNIWKANKSVVAQTSDIDQRVDALRLGRYSETVVIANRYDGIDLPDNACRILIVDGKPYSEGLLDQYEEYSRPSSAVVATRTARVVEQGLGRAVRGEKDYCVVILNGADLVKAIRTQESREYYSEQTRAQIELGIEIATMTGEDIRAGVPPLTALHKVISQCLDRDQGWKDFYREKMDLISDVGTEAKLLNVFAAELTAEELFMQGRPRPAVAALQALLDSKQIPNKADQGWYLQEMARYLRTVDRTESLKLQAAAHARNRFLLKPQEGVNVQRLPPFSQRRVLAIIEWIARFDTYEALHVAIESILSNLRFGVRAEPFEIAIDELGQALGFSSERPDREWKEGPDNLWALRDGEYLVIECKSEVSTTRREINKHETGQMNNAIAWFEREYKGTSSTNVLIIPTRNVARAAGFNQPVSVMREGKLRLLTENVRRFFSSFREMDLKGLADSKVQELLDTYSLSIDDIKTMYSETTKVG